MGEIIEESSHEIERAHKFLLNSNIDKDETMKLIGFVRTKQLGSIMLMTQKHTVEGWLETGMITAREAEHLLHPLSNQMSELRGRRFEVLKPKGLKHSGSMDMSIASTLSMKYEKTALSGKM